MRDLCDDVCSPLPHACLLVVDERIAFRIGTRLPPRLPPHHAHLNRSAKHSVLATTGHANDRVVADLKSNSARHHRPVASWRGQVCNWQKHSLPSEIAGWHGSRTRLPKLPGSGVIYTLTIRGCAHGGCVVAAKNGN